MSSNLLVDLPPFCLTHSQMENRLREIREAQGKTLDEIALAAGTTNQQLSMLERGKRKLTVEWMNRLARPLKVQPSELMLLPTAQRRLRLIGKVQAGIWRSPDEQDDHDGEYFDVPLPTIYSKLRPYALRVLGPSMNLAFPEGTILICCHLEELREEPIPGKRYIIQDINPHGEIETTVKEYVIDANGRPWAWPRSDDPEWQEPIALDKGREGHEIIVKARVIFTMKPE